MTVCRQQRHTDSCVVYERTRVTAAVSCLCCIVHSTPNTPTRTHLDHGANDGGALLAFGAQPRSRQLVHQARGRVRHVAAVLRCERGMRPASDSLALSTTSAIALYRFGCALAAAANVNMVVQTTICAQLVCWLWLKSCGERRVHCTASLSR
jgi:hypothetical protein